MPPLKSIKNIVERMKHMSPNLIVSANQFGNFTLKIESNMITVAAHFQNLSVHSFAGKFSFVVMYKLKKVLLYSS